MAVCGPFFSVWRWRRGENDPAAALDASCCPARRNAPAFEPRACAFQALVGPAVAAVAMNDDTPQQSAREESVRPSEERNARAIEALAAGYWDWNLVTEELFVSQRARVLL